MTRHDIAKLACKILALWCFGQAVLSLDNIVTVAMFLFSDGVFNFRWQRLAFSLAPAFTPLASALLGSALWWFSDSIATRMAMPDSTPVTSKGLDSRTLESVAISIIGVYFAVHSTRSLTYSFFSLSSAEASHSDLWSSPRWQANLWADLATLALSIWLIFGSRGIAKMIRKYRASRVPAPAQALPDTAGAEETKPKE